MTQRSLLEIDDPRRNHSSGDAKIEVQNVRESSSSTRPIGKSMSTLSNEGWLEKLKELTPEEPRSILGRYRREFPLYVKIADLAEFGSKYDGRTDRDKKGEYISPPMNFSLIVQFWWSLKRMERRDFCSLGNLGPV